ncbi:MAG: helix-turn-helix transcriptional regulator [Treponema sp.]|jgi:transcriptional regulator with XRE-family HTH domain|nr:helix-turn-helix transcriptional regulator [Treponema sp.]
MSRGLLWANNIEKTGRWAKGIPRITYQKEEDKGGLTIQDLFIANLKGYRKLHKISQMRLAELCDSSTGYIGEIESGKRFPSVNMIERIAKALKIESYFLFRNEPIEPSPSNTSIESASSQNPASSQKLAPSQKKRILDKVNSAISKVLDDF